MLYYSQRNFDEPVTVVIVATVVVNVTVPVLVVVTVFGDWGIPMSKRI